MPVTRGGTSMSPNWRAHAPFVRPRTLLRRLAVTAAVAAVAGLLMVAHGATAGTDRSPRAAAAGVGPAVTRTEILARARTWADAHVPYSQSANRDGYRTDCSG